MCLALPKHISLVLDPVLCSWTAGGLALHAKRKAKPAAPASLSVQSTPCGRAVAPSPNTGRCRGAISASTDTLATRSGHSSRCNTRSALIQIDRAAAIAWIGCWRVLSVCKHTHGGRRREVGRALRCVKPDLRGRHSQKLRIPCREHLLKILISTDNHLVSSNGGTTWHMCATQRRAARRRA